MSYLEAMPLVWALGVVTGIIFREVLYVKSERKQLHDKHTHRLIAKEFLSTCINLDQRQVENPDEGVGFAEVGCNPQFSPRPQADQQDAASRYHSMDCTCHSDPRARCVIHDPDDPEPSQSFTESYRPGVYPAEK